MIAKSKLQVSPRRLIGFDRISTLVVAFVIVSCLVATAATVEELSRFDDEESYVGTVRQSFSGGWRMRLYFDSIRGSLR